MPSRPPPYDAVLLTGTVGAGKTTTAHALSALELAHGRRHTVVDLDEIHLLRPPPPHDRFAHEVAAYSGDTLPGLLSYLDLARRHEDGLALGEVTVRSDRVQLLTAHKAKGLEWDVVSVLHADAGTYSAKASTFLTNPTRLPDEEFAALAADDRKEFEDLAKEYIADRRAAEAEGAAE